MSNKRLSVGLCLTSLAVLTQASKNCLASNNKERLQRLGELLNRSEPEMGEVCEIWDSLKEVVYSCMDAQEFTPELETAFSAMDESILILLSVLVPEPELR